MRNVPLVCLALVLAGCGTLTEAADKAHRDIDDQKCREFGFKPGTEAYGNCRLELERIRAARATAAAPAKQQAVTPSVASAQGQKVYDASECIGPVIMGQCHGSILPQEAFLEKMAQHLPEHA